MGSKTNNGFTIIEVMLFLAVTGALAVAILVGAGVSIGQQRYRDSVNSLKSFVQTQYNEVTNVVNDRDKNWTCDANGNVTSNQTGDGEPRGTSDCVILGRFITVDDTGTKVSSSNVIGYRHPNATTAGSDIAELRTNYDLTLSPINPETTEISWGAQVVQPKTTTPMPISMLILRSPLSGSVMTFTQDGVQTNVANMIVVANTTGEKNLCVNAEVGSFVGKRLAVQISAYATNQGAVQIPPESAGLCD
jgi:type II secretory pathway pseudopilin PulG